MYIITGMVDDIGLVLRNNDWEVPLPAIFEVLLPGSFGIMRIGRYLALLPGSPVGDGDFTAICSGPDNVRIGRMYGHVGTFSTTNLIPVFCR